VINSYVCTRCSRFRNRRRRRVMLVSSGRVGRLWVVRESQSEMSSYSTLCAVWIAKQKQKILLIKSKFKKRDFNPRNGMEPIYVNEQYFNSKKDHLNYYSIINDN